VGAGIGGLTLAAALGEAGFRDVTVYDRGVTGAPRGPDLVVSPNGTRVLRALHLGPFLAGAGKPDAYVQRGWRSGFVLAHRPLGAFMEARYGAPEVVVARQALLDELATRCAHHGVTVRPDQACARVVQDARSVTLTSDSESLRHDVVIGCDGENSTVRANMGYAESAPTTHDAAWTGSCPASDLPAALRANAVTTWLGPGAYLTHWPTADGNGVAFLAFARNQGPQTTMADAFRNWHDDVSVLAGTATGVSGSATVEREPIAHWYDRRVALLGDACHPVTPHLLQGASLALEDAWVLSRMIERWEDEPARGFADYERYRKVRLRRFRQGQRRHVAELTADAGGAAWRRNLRLSLTSRFLPEIAMQRLDWLYGYDCIKGFE
jgi:2-polyprenyl-6-methoxyphenol hydroxylase-like FAD-dependent oxidoreductase